jgi:biotin synthase
MIDLKNIIEKLLRERSLSVEEYEQLIEHRTPEIQELLRCEADKIRKTIYGNKVYIRGLIEVSNICKNNCYYCGIRGENTNCQRYRLTADEILECCDKGYELGFRTFVMQGGEDGFFTDEVMCELVREIKSRYPDCAVTLSLGERSYESYKRLYNAGADRYLLRHEAVSSQLYGSLHPKEMKIENRLQCLENLKKIGFQTGCGFMVGAPHQTARHIAEDLKFIENFKPQMCGIGPFIPHKDTTFKDYPKGSAELTCFLLSIVRIVLPSVLLPATTALGTAENDGRERGILSGANVVMPNLSPESVRAKYALYDNKISTGAESAQHIAELKAKMARIGYDVVCDRGDYVEK